MNPVVDMDDDLPAPPATGAAAEPVETVDVPAETYGAVPKMGDVIAAGTYHARLHSYQKAKYEDGPVYSLQWRIQEETNNAGGRVVFSNCPWPTAEDIKLANDANSPAGAKVDAQKRVNDRLVVAKAIQEAAGIKPGTMPFEQFLATNPELKIQISITDKKERKVGEDGTVTFPSTGEKKNKVQKYISLTRPQ